MENGPRLSSRRTLLKAAGVGVFGLGSAAVLPLFGTGGAIQNPAKCRATDISDSDRKLVVSNWPDYIDHINKPGSTVATFEQRTGISVDYTDDVNDNAEFFAKVRNQLGSCQPIDRDIMVLTDWMAARMINLGWVQPLDAKKVPNLHQNLIASLKGRAWDPKETYHAPWQSGLTGIAYNRKLTGEVKSFEELLTRSDLKGKITLLSEMRDTMAFMVRLAGGDPEDFTDDQWQNGLDKLRAAVSDGQVRAFTGNEYIQDLEAGNIVACEAWSGDVMLAQYDNEDIQFVVPEEGLAIWADNMLVPNLAQHESNAEAWIDYFYQPTVAAKLAAYVNYICPVEGAREAMEKIDPSLVDQPLIFPDKSFLANTFAFMALTEDQNRQYEGDFADVTGG